MSFSDTSQFNSDTNQSTTSQSYRDSDCGIEHNTNDSVQEGELESLIRVLSDKFNNRDPQVKSVKYPALLMSSLVELRNLVGMDRLKDSIALQVMRLVDCATNGEKNGKMLNTILYGDPGVGKTKVGIILAKIWYSLGYLKKPVTQQKVFQTSTTTTAVSGTEPGMGALIPIILLVLFYGFTYIVAGASYLYNNWGFVWLASVLLVIAIVLLLVCYKGQTYISKITNMITKTEDLDPKKVSQLEDRDLIKVVSRKDFIAEYMGQSAIKTRALLSANLGKVLLIDEAYSLYNGERDQYGMEALTELNLFMSENPDGIAVIFAGYKDLMKWGIFSVQPGLPRRCMWHFECQPYNGQQLADIFFRQAYSDNYYIGDHDVPLIRKLISDNAKLFKSYGGDTERLLFYSQLEASRSNVLSSKSSEIWLSDSSQGSYDASDTSQNTSQNTSGSSKSADQSRSKGKRVKQKKINKVLTYSHVQHGMRRLNENKIDD